MQNIILDTNKLFSSLLSPNSAIQKHILSAQNSKFYICKFCLVELFHHKEKIIKSSKLTEDDLLTAYYQLLKAVHIYDEDTITPENWQHALSLCKGVDEKDTVFIALTLQLKGKLWTGDLKLVKGLTAKGFNDFY